MNTEWAISLDGKTIYGCLERTLWIKVSDEEGRVASTEEQKSFISQLLTLDVEEFDGAYLADRIDMYRDHFSMLDYEVEQFPCWNEVAPGSYSEYLKIYHPNQIEMTIAFSCISTPTISNENEIVDEIKKVEIISIPKYESAKDRKIGSLKLQLLDMGITELKA